MLGKITERLFFICATISATITVLIFGFMVFLGLPLIKGGQFFHLLTQPWLPDHNLYGIYPMVMGTVFIASLGVVLAFPLSIGCASLITVIDGGIFSRILRRVVQMMTGIPTVIYGFVGLFLLVPFVRELFMGGSGMCVLSASIMLAILVAPTMILFFVDSFESVPKSYMQAVDSLGGSKVQKLIYIVIPGSWSGIMTGLVLSLGRAFGDTLIALMIAGNAVQAPSSLLDSARTLTAHIALVIASDYESLEFKSIFACGIVLYVFTTLLVVLVRSFGYASRRNNE